MTCAKEFYNHSVLITGAASGIGHAQAEVFLAAEAKVFGIDQQEAPLIELQKRYPNFAYAVCDISDEAALATAHQQAIAYMGPVQILLNTAGILDDYRPALETSLALWDQVMNINLRSMYHLTTLCLPDMVENRGVIINMASIAGLVAGGGGVAYTAAKHAIVGLTKQLSLDYASQGVRVNAIAPGAIDTPMNAADFAGDGAMAKQVAEETPAKRWAQPEEVAQLTLFLASQAADYIHGTIVPIDGGWIAK